MDISFRRYEILMPLRFNDGTPVPEPLVADTLIEIRTRFGAVSCETQVIRGLWESGGEIYRDENLRLFVDVEDSKDSRAFFLELKGKLKSRFKQLDIWMTSHIIDVL